MMKHRTWKLSFGFSATVLGSLFCHPPHVWASFEAISVTSQGTWGGAFRGFPGITASMSGDGRFVVFPSNSKELLGTDQIGPTEVFVRDRILGTTQKIDTAPDGSNPHIPIGKAESSVSWQGISRDGRYIVFSSGADNLLDPGIDTNEFRDVFLRDLQTGKTTLVSRPQGFPAIQANGDSSRASISADGTKVVFTSTASNLVSGDTNLRSDIFLFDVATQKISRINVTSAGAQTKGPEDLDLHAVINGDGTMIAFQSWVSDLVPDDLNDKSDIFIRDLRSKIPQTYRISVSSTNGELNDDSANPGISEDGCHVSFVSDATNVLAQPLQPGHVFVRDLCHQPAPTIFWVSQSSDGKEVGYNDLPLLSTAFAAISGNGQCVAFTWAGANLASLGQVVPDLENVYLRNLTQGTIQLLSSPKDGTRANGDSEVPWVNHDCSVITFFSRATNLVPGTPSSGHIQVFAYSRIQLTASFKATSTNDPFTFHFDSSSSQAQGGTIASYAWDFGDGSTSIEANPTHTYGKAGTYPVKLTLTDNDYDQASILHDVIVSSRQLSGGGFLPNCSTQPGYTQDLASAWFSLLVFGSLLLIAGRIHFRKPQ